MKPGWPTPAVVSRPGGSGDAVLTGALLSCLVRSGLAAPGLVAGSAPLAGLAQLAHLVEQGFREVTGLDVGERQEGLRALDAGNLEDRAQQQLAQVRVVAHAQPYQQVEAAGDHA